MEQHVSQQYGLESSVVAACLRRDRGNCSSQGGIDATRTLEHGGIGDTWGKMAAASKWNLSREDIKTADKDERELLLEHDSDQDENIMFNRPSTSTAETKVDGKMDSVRLQIQEVTEVMRENVQKVMERGDKLEDLQEASDRLNSAGNEFRSAAKKAQQRAWFQNFRARIILVTITMTVVICIIVLDILVLYLVLR